MLCRPCLLACAVALALGCSPELDAADRPPVVGDCTSVGDLAEDASITLCRPTLARGGANGPATGTGTGGTATTDGGPLPNPPTGVGQNGGISGGNPPGGSTGVGGINGAAGSNGTGGLIDFDASIGLGPGIPQ